MNDKLSGVSRSVYRFGVIKLSLFSLFNRVQNGPIKLIILLWKSGIFKRKAMDTALKPFTTYVHLMLFRFFFMPLKATIASCHFNHCLNLLSCSGLFLIVILLQDKIPRSKKQDFFYFIFPLSKIDPQLDNNICIEDLKKN